MTGSGQWKYVLATVSGRRKCFSLSAGRFRNECELLDLHFGAANQHQLAINAKRPVTPRTDLAISRTSNQKNQKKSSRTHFVGFIETNLKFEDRKTSIFFAIFFTLSIFCDRVIISCNESPKTYKNWLVICQEAA